MKKEDIKETYTELAHAFKNSGSTKAFTKLYYKMLPNLRNYVFNIVKDIHATDDIISTTMTKVYTKIHQYNPEFQITTWAYKIAYHEAIYWIRERNKKVSLSYYAEKGYEVGNSGAGSSYYARSILNSTVYDVENEKTTEDYLKEDQILENRYEKAIEEIHNLKPIYRGIIIDRLLHHMSYRDIEIKVNSPRMKEYRMMINQANLAKNRKDMKTYDYLQKNIRTYRKKHIINQQTVKNRINRGRKILSEKLSIEIPV